MTYEITFLKKSLIYALDLDRMILFIRELRNLVFVLKIISCKTGNLNGEFWLGLDKINRLTKAKNRLRVDLEDTTGKTAYAEYDVFAVTSERTKY